MDNILSIAEASIKLRGISENTIIAWLQQGKLRPTKVDGRTMVAKSELQKLFQVGGVSAAGRRNSRNQLAGVTATVER